MARLSHADQSRLPLPRLHPRRAHRARPYIVSRLSEALQRFAKPGHSGMAQLLLQVSHDRSGIVPRARSLHSVDEAEEHAEAFEGRGVGHASGAGVLRLANHVGAGDSPVYHLKTSHASGGSTSDSMSPAILIMPFSRPMNFGGLPAGTSRTIGLPNLVMSTGSLEEYTFCTTVAPRF